ncbi:MAG: hypothetical protein HN509_03370 [Halobacteriovoraceae bacterium]|nr:hypothetical protein [Halobacteriovoraceae bacterium]
MNLIKTEYREVEKRILPRFPFSYLTFKGQERVYEVKNMSFEGMQLRLKEGGHKYQKEQDISGILHWKGLSLEIKGLVKWISGSDIGVSFTSEGGQRKAVEDFLSVDNILSSMRPLHRSNIEMDLPTDLKYWLRADGPMEVFVWQHTDRECARFQVILMDNFIEWEDGLGLKTGSVLSHKESETPLSAVDEFEVEIDQKVSSERLSIAHSVVSRIGDDLIPNSERDFLILKLGS